MNKERSIPWPFGGCASAVSISSGLPTGRLLGKGKEDETTLGPTVTVGLAGPGPSWVEAMCLGGKWDVVGFRVEREGNGREDMVRGMRDCAGVLKTERIASDLVLAWVDEFEPAEKLRAFAAEAAWEMGTREERERSE